MMRVATLLWAVLAAVAGTGLFMLKYEVQAQEQRLADLHKDIVETEESIHVLKAEWSYLNEPMRLREETERNLGMHPLKPGQIASIDSIAMAGPSEPTAPATNGLAAVASNPPAPTTVAPTPRPADPKLAVSPTKSVRPVITAKAATVIHTAPTIQPQMASVRIRP